MNLNKIEGNTIIVFRNGRDANRFRESRLDVRNPVDESCGLCAYRFVDGRYSGWCADPVDCYDMGDDFENCKTATFLCHKYKVIFWRPKAEVL